MGICVVIVRKYWILVNIGGRSVVPPSSPPPPPTFQTPLWRWSWTILHLQDPVEKRFVPSLAGRPGCRSGAAALSVMLCYQPTVSSKAVTRANWWNKRFPKKYCSCTESSMQTIPLGLRRPKGRGAKARCRREHTPVHTHTNKCNVKLI